MISTDFHLSLLFLNFCRLFDFANEKTRSRMLLFSNFLQKLVSRRMCASEASRMHCESFFHLQLAMTFSVQSKVAESNTHVGIVQRNIDQSSDVKCQYISVIFSHVAFFSAVTILFTAWSVIYSTCCPLLSAHITSTKLFAGSHYH